MSPLPLVDGELADLPPRFAAWLDPDQALPADHTFLLVDQGPGCAVPMAGAGLLAFGALGMANGTLVRVLSGAAEAWELLAGPCLAAVLGLGAMGLLLGALGGLRQRRAVMQGRYRVGLHLSADALLLYLDDRVLLLGRDRVLGVDHQSILPGEGSRRVAALVLRWLKDDGSEEERTFLSVAGAKAHQFRSAIQDWLREA